jgi:hypothetical protein
MDRTLQLQLRQLEIGDLALHSLLPCVVVKQLALHNTVDICYSLRSEKRMRILVNYFNFLSTSNSREQLYPTFTRVVENDA